MSEEKIGVQRHKVFCIWPHNYDVRSLGCELETIGLHSPFFSTIVHALNYYLYVVKYWPFLSNLFLPKFKPLSPLMFTFAKHSLVSPHVLSFLSISSAPMCRVTSTHLVRFQRSRTQKFLCPWSLRVVSGEEKIQQRNAQPRTGWQEWWMWIEQGEKTGSEKKVRMLLFKREWKQVRADTWRKREAVGESCV